MESTRITLHVASDGLVATVTIVAGSPADETALGEALRGAKIDFGLDPAACAGIAGALADPEFAAEHAVVARGQLPVASVDALLEPQFYPGIQPGALREDGTMDFHDRELLKPVKQGDVLAWLRRAVPGVPGRRVDGAEIPVAPAREVHLAFGPGVRLEADGAVRAERSGVVLYVPGQSLGVVDHHVHAGDVDLRSGNLSMEGSLVVQGTVQRLFSVRATGDIQIDGAVESGSVRAGADLHVRLGVRGGDAGLVCAEGDLIANHAESATLWCGGSMRIGEAASSELFAARIQVDRRIRGGTASAEQSLIAGEAGSPHGGTETVLVAGEPLESPLDVARRALEVAKSRRVAGRAASPSTAESGARTKGGKFGRALAAMSRREIEHRIEQAERRGVLLRSAEIRITGTAHAGVLVRIGGDRVLLDQPESNVRFFFDMVTSRIQTERSPR